MYSGINCSESVIVLVREVIIDGEVEESHRAQPVVQGSPEWNQEAETPA